MAGCGTYLATASKGDVGWLMVPLKTNGILTKKRTRLETA